MTPYTRVCTLRPVGQYPNHDVEPRYGLWTYNSFQSRLSGPHLSLWRDLHRESWTDDSGHKVVILRSGAVQQALSSGGRQSPTLSQDTVRRLSAQSYTRGTPIDVKLDVSPTGGKVCATHNNNNILRSGTPCPLNKFDNKPCLIRDVVYISHVAAGLSLYLVLVDFQALSTGYICGCYIYIICVQQWSKCLNSYFLPSAYFSMGSSVIA